MRPCWKIAVTSVVVAAIVACGDDKPAPAKHTDASPTMEAGGEVAKEASSSADKIRWLNDANVLALLTTMNQRQIAAADAELSTWHVDTVRAFAAALAREHSELQHSIDSLAAASRITPIAPALAVVLRGRMQAQIDSIYTHGGRGFDRAYVAQSLAGHQLMAQYLSQLSAVAQAPLVSTLIATMVPAVQSQISRATAMRAYFATLDSAAADSARRVAERRSRAGAKR